MTSNGAAPLRFSSARNPRATMHCASKTLAPGSGSCIPRRKGVFKAPGDVRIFRQFPQDVDDAECYMDRLVSGARRFLSKRVGGTMV